jgi:release factor glutamine methyltransferase
MKLKDVLDKTIQFFKEKKVETPRLDAEILLAKALHLNSRVDLYLKYDQPLKEEELVVCREFVKRRSQGEPVAYITGEKGFFDYNFLVNKAVLIPRPETELVVETALDWVTKNKIEKPKILDLGTGSGCIIISLLKKIPEAHGIAVEKSAEAVLIAKENALRLGVMDRLEILEADVMNADFSMRNFDLIVSNPPYIAKDDKRVERDVHSFEPNSALYAEDNGRADLFHWSEIACPWLKEKAIMIFEMGFEQGPEMLKHFEKLNSFQQNKILKDLSGHDRIIVGEKNG